MKTIQKKSFEAAVLALFGKAIKGSTVSFEDMQTSAFKKGYVVHPNCCTEAVLGFINSLPSDYNATFYKEWQDVESKSRTEIWLDQITSYIFAFGANEQFIPNDGSEQPQWEDLKVVEPISVEEAIERAKGMLYAPIAMKQETIELILDIVDADDIDVDKIANREAMLLVCDKSGVMPSDPIEMLRYAVYKATGKTMLIKDRETIAAIRASSLDVREMFIHYGLKELSTIFNRFKKLFLAFRKNNLAGWNRNNTNVINKINRLAKKHHKPMKVGYWERLLSDPSCVKDLSKRLGEVDNFKKVKLLTAINERALQFGARFYTIRNGRIWVKEGSPKNRSYYKVIASMIRNSLVESLKEKATTVFIPKGVHYKVPTSEKKFIGNFPLGTAFDFGGKNAVFGIHRTKEYAIGYLDFSLLAADGTKIGWDSSFNKDSILFSGDIHGDGRSETVELMYARNGMTQNYITAVNDYNNNLADGDIHYSAFLAIEKMDKPKRNHMVDPNNIVFNIPLKMEMGSDRQVSFGVLTPTQFILSELKTGSKAVSGKNITSLYSEYAPLMSNCYIDLKTILLEAGFNFVDQKDAEIDLSVDTLSKDSIMSLFA